MTNEEKLRDFLERALNYMEKDDVNLDTAQKYRAAASHNLLCVIKSLTKEDILNKLGGERERTRDRKTAARLLEKFIKSEIIEKPDLSNSHFDN